MTDRDRPEIDDLLRRAFEPDASAVARAANRALGASPGSLRRLRLTRPATAAAAAVLALAALFTVNRGSQTPAPPVGPEVLAGTLSGGMLVIQMPDGSVSITGGPAREGRSPEGHGLLLVEGAPR